MDCTEEFLNFAASLKLIRKAEIEAQGKSVIDEVYTDLLPNNGILNFVNLPRTSILKGRKGTGKSTIFQKSQNDMLIKDDVVTIYIDVKTLYDNATPTLNGSSDIEQVDLEIKKYFIYKNFLFEVINKANENFEQTLKNQSFIKRFKGFVSGISVEIDKEFEKMKNNIDDVVKQIDMSLYQKIRNSEETSENDKSDIEIVMSKSPEIKLGNTNTKGNLYKKEFISVMHQYFDIKGCLINQFLKIRDILKVKYIYIYLDDYSEMYEEAQEIFMDWFVAPLNNTSEDFIKFKIATYPIRFYMGKLDNQNIVVINLDFYSALYSYKNVVKMEEITLNYIKRLIKNRFDVFLPRKSITDYFDMPEEELFELLFDMTLNIPRKIGFIFSYCYTTHITMGKKITKAALNAAARRYYEEVTEAYFEANRYVVRAFGELATIENLKCLMEKIVLKEQANHILVNQQEKRRLPTSHFVIDNSLCRLLDTLELNGYISTYNKLNDKDNIPSTLYALDYGLCQKYMIEYGRPKESSLRKYYLERKFTFNNLVKEHFNSSQVLECPNGHTFPYEEFDNLNNFGMICPQCAKKGIYVTCITQITNRNIIELIQAYSKNKVRLNDDLEYGILNFLRHNENRSYSASEIAENLDCTYQLITKRADKLIGRELIKVDRNVKRRYFVLTDWAKEILGSDIEK